MKTRSELLSELRYFRNSETIDFFLNGGMSEASDEELVEVVEKFNDLEGYILLIEKK